MTLVVAMFFFQSVPHLHTMSLGWCALLGVMLLLIIIDR